LVGPETIIELGQDLPDAVQARRKELACRGIRFGHVIDLGAVRLENTNILSRRFEIDDTDEPKTVIGTGLSKADPHIAGARLDNYRARSDRSLAQRSLKDLECRAILDAPAGIERLELGEQPETKARIDTLQIHKRSLTYYG